MKQSHIVLLSCLSSIVVSLPLGAEQNVVDTNRTKERSLSSFWEKLQDIGDFEAIWKRAEPFIPRPVEGSSSGRERPGNSRPASFGGSSSSSSSGTFGGGNRPTVPNEPASAPRPASGTNGGSSPSSELSGLHTSDQLPQLAQFPNPPREFAFLYQEATDFLRANPIGKDRSIFYDRGVVEKADAFSEKNNKNPIYNAFRDEAFKPGNAPGEQVPPNQDPPYWRIVSGVYAEGTSGTAIVMIPREGVQKVDSFWAQYEWPNLLRNGVTVKWVHPDINPATPDAPGMTKILWQPGDNPNMAFPLFTSIDHIGHA